MDYFISNSLIFVFEKMMMAPAFAGRAPYCGVGFPAKLQELLAKA
jgi:hypothetical protein